MSSTACSSLWLARVAQDPQIVGPRELIRSLSRLPINVLLWPTDIQLRLVRFGVLKIGDLLRLPRGGLARRIGYMNGSPNWIVPVGATQMCARTYSHGILRRSRATGFRNRGDRPLSVIIEKRLQRLQAFPTRKNLAVDAIRIQLRHREHAETPVMLGLARATADMQLISFGLRSRAGSFTLNLRHRSVN